MFGETNKVTNLNSERNFYMKYVICRYVLYVLFM